MNVFTTPRASALAALVGALAVPAPALACGGFFCSQTQPVNQAAERIVFADNGNGTVTAVIQILYEGPSENFSWLLPISSVPMGDEIAVASDLAFQRLQAATNPQYSLTTRIEGTCRQDSFDGGAPSAGTGGTSFGGGAGTGGAGPGPGVVIEGSGVVGAFEWIVISLDASLPEPADVALEWLGENGYDVPEGAGSLIGPYLEDGLYLLALRLTKGSDTGSIRPIVLTYDAARPMIPIKLTAVAANADMGVMTWVLGEGRAVPMNYLSLELNEARINWFNASSNYNDVVTAAANEGDGRGFVTEFSDESATLSNVVWSLGDANLWDSVRSGVYTTFQELFNITYSYYGGWDGYWDAVRATVTLPDDVSFADFQLCPTCYSAQVQFSPAAFMAAVEQGVIEPVRMVQGLIDAAPRVTRLYTTMSAEEMIVDPIFTFNPELESVSNIHTAERVIECNPDVQVSQAPWRIELPQGGVVRGVGSPGNTWPSELATQPANLVISRQGESGDGQILEDNSEAIMTLLDEYNSSFPGSSGGGSGGTGGTGGTSGATGGSSGSANAMGGSAAGAAGTEGAAGRSGGLPRANATSRSGDSGGCSVRSSASGDFAWALFAVLGLALRHARRRKGL